ncbi:MAG: tripartite tricarboxylate transporter permease [Rhodospirillales bacterium]
MDLIPLSLFIDGASSLASPMLLLWIFVGVLVGLIFGAAPGLTATAGVAIATPLTFGASFETSMALLLGIYCGGYFAGSIPAILINTPGAPGNAATALDGYRMARAGRADQALSLAVIASFIGGITSVVVLMLAAPTLADFALRFTSVEYFSLGLFGLVCIAAVSGGSVTKGVICALLGILLGSIGIDPVGGMTRLTADIPDLLGGIPLIPALIAFFAVTEMLNQASLTSSGDPLPVQQVSRLATTIRLFAANKWLTLKSALIGTGIGVLPGTGPTIAAWIAFGESARAEQSEDEQKNGNPRGIIASETANNAVTGGAMIPLLTLGIPGDTVTAVLIGALLIQGITPGPFFMLQSGDLFVQILLILAVANLFILIIGLGARRILPSILNIPPRILIPIIGVLCVTGTFAINNVTFEVMLIAILGASGYLLLCFGFPMAPLVLGLVLGPMIETNLRNGLTANELNPMIFLTRPISGTLLAGAVLTVLWSWWRGRRRGQ